MGEIEALRLSAPGLAEPGQLLLRLDALGDRVQVQRVGHVDDGAQHPGLLLGVEDVADKGHVQLDAVERQGMDVLQRRVARPEVVEEDPDPRLPKPVERCADLLQVYLPS